MRKNKNVFDTHETDEDNLYYCPQGSIRGIKAIGFRTKNINREADALGLHKDGRSCKGTPPCFRPCDNSKRRGIKRLKKEHRKYKERIKWG